MFKIRGAFIQGGLYSKNFEKGGGGGRLIEVIRYLNFPLYFFCRCDKNGYRLVETTQSSSRKTKIFAKPQHSNESTEFHVEQSLTTTISDVAVASEPDSLMY